MTTRRRHLAAAALVVLLGSATAPSVSYAQNACVDAFVVSAAQKQALARAIVISAPSGGGKTTLMKMLVAEFPELFAFSVSTTTRQPRPGEVNGVDYEFITVAEFKSRIERGEFVEHAEVHGNYYGTSKTKIESILASGRSPLLLVDVQGADVLRNKLNVPYQTIFVQPPNMKVLEERLVGRQTDAPEVIAKRLKNAAGEMARAGEFDVVVINDKLDKAYVDLKAQLLAPAYSHSPVAKFAWPKDGMPTSMEKISSFAVKAMKSDLRFKRIDAEKDVEWVGLSKGRIEESKYVPQFLKASALENTRRNQGRDTLAEITGATVLVGIENGLKTALHPEAKAKLADQAKAIRQVIAAGQYDQAIKDLTTLEAARSSMGERTGGPTRPLERVGGKVEWPTDGSPVAVSELAKILAPVFEQAYSIKGSGDTRAKLVRHVEDALRLGQEQGRRLGNRSGRVGMLDIFGIQVMSAKETIERIAKETDPVLKAQLEARLADTLLQIEATARGL